MAVRHPDADIPLRELISRYGLRQVDVARHAKRTTCAMAAAFDRDQLRGLSPKTRKRYLTAIEQARQDVLRRVAS